MIHLRKFATGVAIEIDRPKSLGALDTECFDRIEEALEEARQCSNVAWVAFFSRLPRGFCAGGDVRKLHDDYKKSKSFEAAERFFSTEYRVDQKVWNFPKPVIALTHGITMGGGIGLIRGASHRVVAPDSILAMPEISIGLYPDVGATYFLQQIPQPERSLVAYCAARFGPAEALRWNVATHCVAESAHGQGHLLLPALDTLEWHGNSKDLDTVSHWLNRYSMRPPPQWEAVSPEIEALFNRTTAQEIFEQASHLNFPILEPVKNGSPLSACVIHEQLSRASSLTLAEAFDWEFHLSMGCLRWGDFFEGVRARLIERSSG
ncbi:MAG: enoyl-CoA hydratase/isomerase family protein, partial [Oligoflexia bacterium]